MMHTITSFRHRVHGFLMVTLALYSVAGYTQLRTSVRSGIWSNKNTWDCTCVPASTEDVVISSGHRVTLVSGVAMRHLTLNTGSVITDNGKANTISGNFTVNGTYSGSGTINLTGANTQWDGTGTITNLAALVVTGNPTIQASAQLTINNSDLIIQGPYTITNHGTITVGGNITGTVAASTWMNEANATLNIGGSSGVPLLATGTLDADAPGNTVNYFASYAHTLKLPATQSGFSTYHHLIISGTNTKTVPNGEVAVNGDLTIFATLSGSGSSKKLYLRGNWINNGNFTEGTGEGTITFDGTTDQYITRSATENMNVVVIDKPAGRLILNTNLIAERGLVLKSGNIITQPYTLTLGLSTTVPGTLTYTAGTIVGKFQRWVVATGTPTLFPIGTSAHSRPASITFNALTPGTLTAVFMETAPGKNGLPLSENGVTSHNTFRDGYWSLSTTQGLTSSDYDLDLYATGFIGFTINDNTRLLARNAGALAWSWSGTHRPRIGTVIRRQNISLLPGEYALGDDTACTAPQPVTIAGNTEVCLGATSIAYGVTINPASTYRWRVDGGTVTSGEGTANITVDWGQNGKTGEVAVVEKNGCTEGAEARLPVNIHALPVTTLTGKLQVPELTLESYSVAARTHYTYNWTVIGGAITAGQGTNTITVNWGATGAGSVCVTGQHAPPVPAMACGQSVSLCASITIYKVIRSVRSGNWQTPACWDCACVPGTTDHVVIGNTHTLSLSANRTTGHLTILAGGELNTNSNQLTVQGDLAVQGTLNGTGPVILIGSGATWDGNGLIINTGTLTIANHRTILPNAHISKPEGTITLGAGVVVTNQGMITLGGNLTGTDAASRWVNATNATLRIGGDLLNTGKLEALAPGNTVWFLGTTAQMIPIPTASQYANLIISGIAATTAPASVLLVSGNLLNDGNFQPGGGTITFNGTSQVTGATTKFHHLVLKTGSALTFTSETVNVTGNLDFEPGSTFDPAMGKITLTGNGDQGVNFQGATCFDLAVNKASGAVVLTSPLALLHRLTIQSPTQVQANGNLIITSRGSTTDQDAGIEAIPTGAAVVGPVQVQRYMHPIGQANRYLASPVQLMVPAAQWSDDFALGNGSIRYYHEPAAGPHAIGYVNQPLSGTLQTGRGYLAWMYNGSNPVTWDVEGIPHQGSVILPMSYTATTGGPASDGWNLLGNPYPSAIQWSNDPTAWTRSADISPIIYVTDMQTNRFRLYNAADQTGDLSAGVIAMGQAFWVKANQATTALTIHEPAKTTAIGTFYRHSEAPSLQALISFTDGYQTDVAYLKTNPKASPSFDHTFDGMKLKGTGLQVYFIDQSEQLLAMHTLAEIADEVRVRIGLEVENPGWYQVSFSGLETLQAGAWYLEDRLDKRHWRIQEAVPYEVFIPHAYTPMNDRFYLIRYATEKPMPIAEQPVVYPNPVHDFLQVRVFEHAVTWRLLDNLGNTVTAGDEPSKSLVIDMREINRGVYVLQISCGNQMHTRKIIKH